MTAGSSSKRAVDLALAVPGLIVTAPVQIAIAVAVRCKLGRPVLFRQIRPGLGGQPFELIKFRTMVEPDPSCGLTSDEDRLTSFGAWLRSTSLDELPTLWNVVKGEMSLVGPRPLLMRYLDRYTPEQARRHEVKPGLTGLAQVSGRNSISWDERLALDVKYVDTHTLGGDLKLVLLTALPVLRRHGITGVGVATMAEFGGSNLEDA